MSVIWVIDNGAPYSDHKVYFVAVNRDMEHDLLRRAVSILETASEYKPFKVLGIVDPGGWMSTLMSVEHFVEDTFDTYFTADDPKLETITALREIKRLWIEIPFESSVPFQIEEALREVEMAAAQS